MPTYITPAVYIEEVAALPPQVQAVETALPAFIGYTERAENAGLPLRHTPTLIHSLHEYEACFGGGASPAVTLWLNSQHQIVDASKHHAFCLYDSVRLFFEQGGTQCIIVSVGDYQQVIVPSALQQGLLAVANDASITLLVMPEAAVCEAAHTLEATALAQCAAAPNCFALLDLRLSRDQDAFAAEVSRFRAQLGTAHLAFGAAYGPWLQSNWTRTFRLADFRFQHAESQAVLDVGQITQDARMKRLIAEIQAWMQEKPSKRRQLSLQSLQDRLFNECAQAREWQLAASRALNTLPASGAVAGVYAAMDRARGVWKAPANVTLNGLMPVIAFNNVQQALYQEESAAGKSINLIRTFTDKGTLVWGARTLAGTHEWRYIPVRRLFSWVTHSLRIALQPLVFAANDAQTWMRVQSMTELFLTQLWRQGALQGSTPAQAFYVRVGLHQTMTAQDIADGNLVIEIGLAPLRPAEFMIVRLQQRTAA